jgi:hypothetical protein
MGRITKLKLENKFLEFVEQLRDFGKTQKAKNSIHEEIKGKLKSGIACCYCYYYCYY